MDSSKYLARIDSFTEDNLPNLDEVVLGALEFLSDASIPQLDTHAHTRPLVVGSVNALTTGRIMFRDVDALFADEGTYQEVLNRIPSIDAVYIFSASGSKHAVLIAQEMKEKGLPVYLVTSSAHAPAAAFIDASRVHVFPHMREPYTYNTSTYLGMLLARKDESPQDILSFIVEEVAPRIPSNLGSYESFVLTVPPHFGVVRPMLLTKFDELLAPKVTARAFTSEEIKHAKIVVPSPTQFFINFGVDETLYAGSDVQLTIPLPDSAGPVAVLAITYYVIGRIQGQHHPYFRESIRTYIERAAQVFGQLVPVIVE
jgi:hypothetical protein